MATDSKIYDAFDKAMRRCGAYAILSESGEYVARIVFAYPRDGAGRLYCYAQVFGGHMARGSAAGYGYDKGTAAFEAAAAGLPSDPDTLGLAGEHVAKFKAAAEESGGWRWTTRLERMGYRVCSVTG